jgi:hypothetical protein
MSRRRQWIIVIAVTIGVPWCSYHLINYFWRLGFVPQAMGVWNILYASEQSWGVLWLPGGKETGIIVYKMPEAVAAQLEKEGLTYLEHLPAQSHSGSRGRYDTWGQTPVVLDQQWEWPQFQLGMRGDWNSPGIGDYLFRYGFEIPLDKNIEQMVNDALFRPGSYYAYGRTGLIIWSRQRDGLFMHIAASRKI